MPTQCLLVADSARARLFSVQDTLDESLSSGAMLRERQDLVNPPAKLQEQELPAKDRRGGRRNNHGSMRGGGYAVEDLEQSSHTENTRRFVRELVAAAASLVKSLRADQLVVVASPRLLGLLRPEIRKSVDVDLVECAEDLTRQGPARIQKTLAARKLVPPRSLSEAFYRPRAQHPRAVPA